jgi:molecular chaperone DnaK (HSP70)
MEPRIQCEKNRTLEGKKMDSSRYIVGIDLGTTTISLSYCDTLAEKKVLQSFPILQWESENSVVEKEILPSFCYIASKKEAKDKHFLLPFYKESSTFLENAEVVLGRFARKQQSKTPARVIHSAKSWLCHTGVNREGKVLPWASSEITGDKRLSPVEVQSLFLLHLRLCWNHKMASHSESYRLENQQVIITVPASFDEIATNLTLKAALLAGFKKEKISLIEEPQAAFYHWLHENSPEKFFQKNSTFKTLVCDIGGGTSDFSLFEINRKNDGLKKSLHVERTKVSPHILLGGDNFDLKIASLYEEEHIKKEGKKFTSEEWSELISHSREIKETLFNENYDGEELKVAITRSSKLKNLFQSALTLSLSKKFLKEQLLNSFFPNKENDDPKNEASIALTEFGLPYAKNPSLTYHMSQFLGHTKIDSILFVGGSLIPQILQERILFNLNSRQDFSIIALTNKTLELGVSQGASLYGLSLRYPEELLITSGYPRSLYLEIEEKESKERKLLCVLAQGEKRRNIFHSISNLKLAVNQDINLSLYSSEQRPEDKIENFYPLNSNQFKLIAPIQTKIETKKEKEKFIPIILKVGLTETGLLNIFCIPRDKNIEEESSVWEFTFQLRENSQRNFEENINTPQSVNVFFPHEEKLKLAKEKLLQFYGKGKNLQNERPVASKILKDFEKLFSIPRKDWQVETLRELAQPLLENKNTRSRSEDHEAAFFNLLGYFLRPGYGYLSDKSRVKDLSKIFDDGLKHQEARQVQNEWWVFWRRISGGLSKEWQERIFSKLLPKIKNQEASAEMIMTLGSLELICTEKKALLGNQIITELTTPGTSLLIEQKFWALTRLSSRVMVYSGAENILRPNVLYSFSEKLSLLTLAQKKKWQQFLLRFYFHSGRKVGERELDLEEDLKTLYLEEMKNLNAKKEELLPIEERVHIKEEERKQLLGDSLPCGLQY